MFCLALCGGIAFGNQNGTCDPGLTCVYHNEFYHQCIKTQTFQYYGVNESGAESSPDKIPGVLGVDYAWPTTASIDYFLEKGFNTFRIPFLVERISPPANGLTGAFDSTYLGGLQNIVDYITQKGGFSIVDPHNSLKYNGAVITSQADFSTWWTNLAAVFKSNPKVIFDINNGPNSISAADAFALNQAGINGIRASGATDQLILVEGTAWSEASSKHHIMPYGDIVRSIYKHIAWTTTSGNAAVFAAIQDPYNKTAIGENFRAICKEVFISSKLLLEMRQFLDADGSGTSSSCPNVSIGAERIAAATTWLNKNKLKGFLGAFSGGSNSVCKSALNGLLSSMLYSGTPVWIGATWWGAGPGMGNSFSSIEPPNGPAISQILPEVLRRYL
ncbi:hypothetical protein FRC02_001784 [Tulasnella sp. 418]|nr:hypothetical protein FRC02_001784 [Tulasnella sp. 418]